MATIKKPFKIFNKAANTWNKYHLETDSTQVTHTKADGTDTTVAEQLLALNSTLKSAIKYVDYTVVLTANGYVTPFSYYANEYLPTSDVEKYGTPISATLMTSSGQAHPVALTLSSNGKYRYTCVATAAKAVMTVVFLKI
jgi:hypothetical protein